MTYDFKVIEVGAMPTEQLQAELNALGREGFSVQIKLERGDSFPQRIVLQRVRDPGQGAAYSKGTIKKGK